MRQRLKVMRQPVYFIPHGGGPWPIVDVGPGGKKSWSGLKNFLETLPTKLPSRPDAVVVISAHWEEPVPTVMSHPNPDLYYDYYGFPEESYHLTWRAPGDPRLAASMETALREAGIPCAETDDRGFDHGTFVPMLVMFPSGEIPIVQLSLRQGLDPAEHIQMGKALEKLRDQNILIIGSGMSYHNMRGYGTTQGEQDSHLFHEWLSRIMKLEPPQRDEELLRWKSAPKALACHPRAEHLLPLMVAAGAGGSDAASIPYREKVLGTEVCAVRFG